jgi:hypothetical protein
MYMFIKELISSKKSSKSDFTVEERNLISTSFKNSIENDRKSMKIIKVVSGSEKFEKYNAQIKLF